MDWHPRSEYGYFGTYNLPYLHSKSSVELLFVHGCIAAGCTGLPTIVLTTVPLFPHRSLIYLERLLKYTMGSL